MSRPRPRHPWAGRHRNEEAPIDATIAVVRLSKVFGRFWQDLSEDFHVDLRIHDADDTACVTTDTAALILSAGGVEHDALAWLDRYEVPDHIPVFVVGARADRRMAARIVGRGAVDYFSLPGDVEILHNTIGVVLETIRARGDRGESARPVDLSAELIGRSQPMKAVFTAAAAAVRHGETATLIVGENGTGKESLARWLHASGPRSEGVFVTVDCSTLPPHLARAELFGTEGDGGEAGSIRPGLIEVADGGTLLLSDITALPLDLQADLDRFLETKRIERVGATKGRLSDVRLIATSAGDLDDAVRQGGFHRGLFYRLSTLVITVPPLRDRGQDVLLIAKAFIRVTEKHHGLPAARMTPELREALTTYDWPGNVRELKSAVERVVLLSPPGRLEVHHLTATDGRPASTTTSADSTPGEITRAEENDPPAKWTNADEQRGMVNAPSGA